MASNSVIDGLRINGGGDSFLVAVAAEAKKSQTRPPPAEFIPPVPDGYCFVDENFLSNTFSVDGFVKRNSKRITSLEQLKEDLAAYQRILKHSMVLLINEDYSEFINLASNLVSFEKSISNIKKPVAKFWEEISQVQARIDEVISQLNQKQNRIKQIQDNKLRLNMALEIMQYVQRVEKNVQAIRDQYAKESSRDQLFYLMLDETATLVCRMQINFDHLADNVDSADKSNAVGLVNKLRPKFETLSKEIDSMLEEEVIRLLTIDFTRFIDEESLVAHTARIESLLLLFLMNGQQKKLQDMIQTKLVRPHLNDIISDAYIARHGAKAMFERVNQFLDTQCVLLIKVLTSSPTLSDATIKSPGDSFDQSDTARLSQFGFELLSEAIWMELVQALVARCSSLYTLANVDTFHQNYMITFRFVEEFLCKTCLVDYKDDFQRLPSFQMLKEKFNLNVYFFMRLQQLAPKLERSFNEFGFSFTNKTGGFKLNITQIVFDHIVALWCSDVDNRAHFGDLFAYLWKLTLKIMSRFTLWLRNVSFQALVDYQKSTMASFDVVKHRRLIHQLLCQLVFDADLFTTKLTELFRSIIVLVWQSYREHVHPKLASGKDGVEESSLETSFNESIAYFRTTALTNLLQLLHAEISHQCVPILNLVNDIPRLYRRTNKEKPTRASNYIANCFHKLSEFSQMISMDNDETSATRPGWLLDWLTLLMVELTNFYANATLEVLTSVQKTEDSLKKLKKAKPNAQQFRATSSAMSDDDKIRLQIYFDVQEFGVEVRCYCFHHFLY